MHSFPLEIYWQFSIKKFSIYIYLGIKKLFLIYSENKNRRISEIEIEF